MTTKYCTDIQRLLDHSEYSCLNVVLHNKLPWQYVGNYLVNFGKIDNS
jgi:hypothetical protein